MKMRRHEPPPSCRVRRQVLGQFILHRKSVLYCNAHNAAEIAVISGYRDAGSAAEFEVSRQEPCTLMNLHDRDYSVLLPAEDAEWQSLREKEVVGTIGKKEIHQSLFARVATVSVLKHNVRAGCEFAEGFPSWITTSGSRP